MSFFKYQTTKQFNELRNTPGIPVWQRNYHDRIIRNDIEFQIIRQYIKNNPNKWKSEDQYHVAIG